jgi:hypothetical protein
MKNKIFCTSLTCVLIIVLFPLSAPAQMQSNNYRIPTSVLSGGGGAMSSGDYQTNATLGQPSPTMDPAFPPTSLNHALYPGFWYTVEGEAIDICECDLNGDGKCDMLDWLLFGEDWGKTDCGTPPGTGNPPNDCECDLNGDGKCDMLDWLLFGEDWGRTDCPIP